MVSARVAALLCVVAVAALAGCSSLVGGESGSDGEDVSSVTPAPVPTATTPTAEDVRGDQARVVVSPTAQRRYLSLRPTCDRPPGVVVHIQVMALASNHLDPDEGINTTYRFTNASDPTDAAPPQPFVADMNYNYAPLLDPDRVEYGPLRRDGDTATRNVTVYQGGVAVTFRWVLERQTDGPRADCWLTTGIPIQGSRIPADAD